MLGEMTVHTMPLEELRSRAREARRLIARAREISRATFERHESQPGEVLPSADAEAADASHRVGLLLDAAQRLLPGTSLADEHGPVSRTKRVETGWRRVTLRGGTERALDAIERGAILEGVMEDAAGLIAEIGRRSSSVLRAADVVAEQSVRRATRES
jgi:hypothetical protein